MAEDSPSDIRFRLQDVIQGALNDDMVKAATVKFRNACADLESELEYSIQSDLAYNLSAWTYRMFEKAIESMMKGDEQTMRRYLACSEGCYTGRDLDHPVIHGKLFETGAIELRRKVVEAHADLLKNERILDLEDQVRSLVAQVNKLEAEQRDIYARMPKGY